MNGQYAHVSRLDLFLSRLDDDTVSLSCQELREDSLGSDRPEDYEDEAPTEEPLFKVTAYGLRQTARGRFSVVEVSMHRNVDVRGGRSVELGRYTTHMGLPGSFAAEEAAEQKARALATGAAVEYVGFRADSL